MIELKLLKVLATLLALCLVVEPKSFKKKFRQASNPDNETEKANFMLKLAKCLEKTSIANYPEFQLMDYIVSVMAGAEKPDPVHKDELNKGAMKKEASLSPEERTERTEKSLALMQKCATKIGLKKLKK